MFKENPSAFVALAVFALVIIFGVLRSRKRKGENSGGGSGGGSGPTTKRH